MAEIMNDSNRLPDENKKKEIDSCISCTLVSRQTGIIRDCITCTGSAAADKGVIMETQKGFITRIVSEKSFGFIRPHNDTGDVFFHALGCVTPFEELREGVEVEFMTVEDPPKNKLKAIGLVAC